MDEIDDLYQEVILDHNRNPRHFGPLAGASDEARGHNPLCGDRITVQLRMEGDRVADIGFVGTGCAISKASASLMTDAVLGLSRAEAEVLFERFHRLVTMGGDAGASMGKLAAFAGVSDYPARVKCASLAWHTLRAALEGSKAPVSTE